jgi:hypothetical protein
MGLLRSIEKVLCAFRFPSVPPPTFGIPYPDNSPDFAGELTSSLPFRLALLCAACQSVSPLNNEEGSVKGSLALSIDTWLADFLAHLIRTYRLSQPALPD